MGQTFKELKVKSTKVPALRKLILWNSFIILYLLLLTGFNLLLLSFPLTSVLGYEFSALNSLAIVILFGLFTIGFYAQIDNSITARKIKVWILSAVVFLIIPLLISFINLFYSKPCSLSDGLTFYAVLTLPSVIIGGAIGMAAFVLLKRFRRILFFIIYLIIALIPVAEIYFLPQIYFFNPLVGYFPGNIYDEGLSVSLHLVFYRLLNILYFTMVILICIKIFENKRTLIKSVSYIFIIIIAALFIYLSPQLGFSTDRERVLNELAETIETDNFIIHITTGTDENLKKIIVLDHEYYFIQLAEFFNEKPAKKIESFIFADSSQKKRLLGVSAADVAKPWLYQVYISQDSYERTLRHEIAHCFSAEFGSGLFKLAENFNSFLIEGIASAADPVFDHNHVHFMAALAYHNGYKVALPDLFKGFNFFFQTSSLAYTYAGSFVSFLLQRYGIEKFKTLYSNINFQKVYQKSIEQLSNEYFEYLNGFDLKDLKGKADFYFGRKTIFSKVCPRYVAHRLEKAFSHFHAGEIDKAEKFFSGLVQLTDNYYAITGLSDCYVMKDKPDEAAALLSSKLHAFEGTSFYANALLKLGDYHIRNRNFSEAVKFYNEIINLNPSRHLNSLSKIRLFLAESPQLLSDYIHGSSYDRYSIVKEINKEEYAYFSFPVLIELSGALEEDYNSFIRNFDKTLLVMDEESSFAVYKLSDYFAANLDFTRARKMAALALRFNENEEFSKILHEHFNRTNWLFRNGNAYLEKFFNNGL